MGKHNAALLTVVHLRGPHVEGATTPCGEPFTRYNEEGQLVTAVCSASFDRLVTCEGCIMAVEAPQGSFWDGYGRHART